jgi:hypothetical protein
MRRLQLHHPSEPADFMRQLQLHQKDEPEKDEPAPKSGKRRRWWPFGRGDCSRSEQEEPAGGSGTARREPPARLEDRREPPGLQAEDDD